MKRTNLAAAVLAAFSAGPAGAGEWLAGDLHVHTTYSHDSWAPLGDDNTPFGELYTLGHSVAGQFLIASVRGLDFIAITDHEDVRSRADPGFGAHGVLGIPAYENSLDGHAQMLGATHVYDPILSAAAQAAAIRADGGVFQVNHPAGGSVDFPDDADWGEARVGATITVVPDTVEVWNISWLFQPPLPSGNSLDDAVRYWEGWLDRGERIGATGGSDNHWVATTAIQGVGQPTTWVFAADRSVPAILEGLREGRTFVSHQPPNHLGPVVFLEGDADGDGRFEAMVGDEVPRGARLRARLERVPPGALLRIVTSGGRVVERVPVLGTPFVHELALEAADLDADKAPWVRADVLIEDYPKLRASLCDDALGGSTTYCRNRLLVLALTSAIYFAE